MSTQILTSLRRLIRLEKSKRTLLLAKNIPKLTRLLALQETLIAHIKKDLAQKNSVHSPPTISLRPPHKTSTLNNLPSHHKYLLHEAIKDWKIIKETNATLLKDIEILCNKYFYEHHKSYNKKGQHNFSPFKHYSHST
ncbi:hypothetical protein COTS27_00621 [Spirochaetota bacterium]|nr:hypothetical protein COTS27_00621 [Spirochaetota bacterium]